MKTDLYTKIVLTVIAVCLCVIAWQSVSAVRASDDQRVNIVSVNGLPIYNAVPVKMVE